MAACARPAGIFFNLGSTFDSTETSIIGPIGEAPMDMLGTRFALARPACPAKARTVHQGHLFIGATLLHESGMEKHRLTRCVMPI